MYSNKPFIFSYLLETPKKGCGKPLKLVRLPFRHFREQRGSVAVELTSAASRRPWALPQESALWSLEASLLPAR